MQKVKEPLKITFSTQCYLVGWRERLSGKHFVFFKYLVTLRLCKYYIMILFIVTKVTNANKLSLCRINRGEFSCKHRSATVTSILESSFNVHFTVITYLFFMNNSVCDASMSLLSVVMSLTRASISFGFKYKQNVT